MRAGTRPFSPRLFALLYFLDRCRLCWAYWLMATDNILTTQRIDPIVDTGFVSTHVHGVVGGSNFGLNVSTSSLRASQCTSIPIVQDKSNYWYPQLYFHWANGSFSSVEGNPVIYYLFSDAPGNTTAFPDDFRMISGDMTLRSFDPTSFAQQAVTFLCLDFSGKSTRTNELPKGRCASGIRSQINFPSCWDGRNVDAPDHRSHVAFLSTGPDNGTCSDSRFPITLPRIFMEVYWVTQVFDNARAQAAVPNQPFVFSNGDPIGYSYHAGTSELWSNTGGDAELVIATPAIPFSAIINILFKSPAADFYNGWDVGALQRALDACHCNPFGDPSCCAAQGIFDFVQDKMCFISDTVAEKTLGLLPTLPGNNPIQAHCYEQYFDAVTPPLYDPVFVYTSTLVTAPAPTGTIATPAQTASVTQLAQGTCIGNSATSKARVNTWLLTVASLWWIILRL